jgi:hypothetical protein
MFLFKKNVSKPTAEERKNYDNIQYKLFIIAKDSTEINKNISISGIFELLSFLLYLMLSLYFIFLICFTIKLNNKSSIIEIK